MDPTPYFVMGLLFGVIGTLAIQWLANRKYRKALRLMEAMAAKPSDDALIQQRETAEMRHRLVVLEKIITDQPHRLANEIDALRLR